MSGFWVSSAALLALAVWPSIAPAQSAADPYPLPSWYLGVTGGALLPDSARQTEKGRSAAVVFGKMLNEAVSIELYASGQEATPEAGGPEVEATSAGLDLNFGGVDPGSPFFLFGVGVIEEELPTGKERFKFGNLGLGYNFGTLFGAIWRLEARYNVIFSDELTPPSDVVEDVHVRLGFMVPIGRLYRAPPPKPEPVQVFDQDNDGIPDSIDQCPDTPRWARPDATGCIADSDGDGIDDSKDTCPDTPAGTKIDEHGCEFVEPPPAAAVPDPDLDSDGDGVPDRIDECPHTAPDFEVDAKGCIKVEKVVLHDVSFPLDYYALRPDAYRLIIAVAASLKANADQRVEIGGHTDSTGDAAYNVKLSQHRAGAVRDYLLYLGIEPDRLVAKGYGETQPEADNRTEAGRAQNRRVVFKLITG